MCKLSGNKNRSIAFLGGLLLLGAVGAHGAGPITKIRILGLSSEDTFTAGIATNTSANDIIINTFADGDSVPDEGQVVTLQLLDGSNVINHGMSPASFTTLGGAGGIAYGGNARPGIKFFRAGTNIFLKASCGSVSDTQGPFTVVKGANAKLVVIGLPEMSLYPGTDPAYTDGTSGTFLSREPNQAFDIRVILTDDQFNRDTTFNGGSVTFTVGEATLITLPDPGPLTAGQGDFQATITGPNTTRTIIATLGAFTGQMVVTTVGPPSREVFPFPSPFNPTQRNITFRFRLENPETVKLIVTDIFGQQVWDKSVSGVLGFNDVTWNGRNGEGEIVAAGVYTIMVEVGGSIESKKRFGVIK